MANGASADWPPGRVLHLSVFDPRSLVPASSDTSIGSSIEVWRDLSSFTNHLSAGGKSPGPRRIVRDGVTVALEFDGKQRLETPRLAGFAEGEQPFHAFLVLRATDAGPEGSRFLDLVSRGSNPDLARAYIQKRGGFWVGTQPFQDSSARLRFGVHVGDEGVGRVPCFDGEPHLVEVVYAGAQRWAIYQDGRPIGRGKFGSDRTFRGFDGGARLALGGTADATNRAGFFRGQLSEVVLFDRPLSSQEQRRVGYELGTRHGIRTAHPHVAPPVPQYESEVHPILQRHCVECHGGKAPEAGLRLTSFPELIRGGQGGPTVAPGSAARSLLLHVLESGEMPPPQSGPTFARPSDEEIELIRRWIDGGAPGPVAESAATSAEPRPRNSHWAFQELRRPEVPLTLSPPLIRTEIDAFVAARLGAKGLHLSEDASRLTLLRRACLDLTGILPSPAEVDAYLADTRADAYERLLDRLLAAPQFGERWARHWLDGVGYSDIVSIDNDAAIIKPGPGKWEYRDYVVRALNDDRPYDRFLVEQLAGDELSDWRESASWGPEVRERLAATGFLRCAADYTDENELNTLQVRFDILSRTVDMVGGHLLGLTVACARCHDHKYEPITQVDYYRFSAILAPALNPHHWLQPAARQLAGLPPTEKASLDLTLAQARATLRSLREPAEEVLFNAKLAQVPTPIRDDVRTALRQPAAQRSEVQRYLADKFSAISKHSPEEIVGVVPADRKNDYQAAEAKIQEINRRLETAGALQAVYDVAPPSPVHVLRRGNYETPGAEVTPGLFAVLGGSQAPLAADLSDGKGALKSSGRRSALAQALTDWKSPAGALAARVRVNQVWGHLFGVGLVESPENFGVVGSPPSHPELLEWLASEFVREGARLKPLLKRLMSSTAYRQSSVSHVPEALHADPGNRLLWKQRLRRLESEIVRDSLLRAAGRLDLTVGGPPIGITNRPDGKVVEDAGPTNAPWASQRRSLYLLNRRNYNVSLLSAFDQPVMSLTCPRRNSSAVVQQALTMLNDDFVHAQATALAERVITDMPSAEPAEWLRVAFRRALVRPPSPEELGLLTSTLAGHRAAFAESTSPSPAVDRQSLAQVCRVLFNTSEFLYAD